MILDFYSSNKYLKYLGIVISIFFKNINFLHFINFLKFN